MKKASATLTELKELKSETSQASHGSSVDSPLQRRGPAARGLGGPPQRSSLRLASDFCFVATKRESGCEVQCLLRTDTEIFPKLCCVEG